jgi:hypothetical protein
MDHETNNTKYFEDPCVNILWYELNCGFQNEFLLNFLKNSPISISSYDLFDFIIINNEISNVVKFLDNILEKEFNNKLFKFRNNLNKYYYRRFLMLLP